MKKFLLFFTVLVCMSIFSANVFAQDVRGGESDVTCGGGLPPDEGGTSTTTQTTAVHFTRNNGDGTCGDKAQIRMYYSVAPTAKPLLTQIYYQDAPLFANFTPVAGNIADYATIG